MSKEKTNYSLLDIIGILYRWKKPLLILIISVTIGSIIVSSLLDNYYTAYATFVPTNEEQKLFDSAGNLTLYGGDDAVSRVLIFAESSPFVSHMIQKFKLGDRYNIDVSTPKGQNRVEKHFRKLYDIKRNKHSGLEISIQDKDPQVAYDMVIAALDKIEELYRAATSGNKGLIKETYEKAIAEKESELITVADTLTTLRKKFNIFDVKQQSITLSGVLTTLEGRLAYDQAKLITFQEMNAPRDSIINVKARIAGALRQRELMRGGSTNNPDIETSSDIYAFNKGRDPVIYWETKIANLNEELSLIITQFAKFKTHAYSNIAGIIVLEPVQVPNLKSYPIRSFMVIGSTLIAIILGVIGVLILDAYKRINWKDVLYEKPINHT
ncbi:GumC domain-containing protein [Aureispira anguillae]|uniref:Capsule biosynthesis protein n=1 Tax=Aureispira anguillae TaxID=2864201 RepID=A0A915YJT4_9BACT|nr:capsule biosynthesis protein [Aureispira anguillae]BDS14518.1 capsule biosynthesis protein [Aureispira anguillae]